MNSTYFISALNSNFPFHRTALLPEPEITVWVYLCEKKWFPAVGVLETCSFSSGMDTGWSSRQTPGRQPWVLEYQAPNHAPRVTRWSLLGRPVWSHWVQWAPYAEHIPLHSHDPSETPWVLLIWFRAPAIQHLLDRAGQISVSEAFP